MSNGAHEVLQPQSNTYHAHFVFDPPPTGHVQPIRYITNALHRQQQLKNKPTPLRPSSARNPINEKQRESNDSAAQRRPFTASAVLSSNRGQAVVPTLEPPQEHRAPHIIAPFATPKFIPQRFAANQYRMGTVPELQDVPDGGLGPCRSSHARVGHLPPTYPQPHLSEQIPGGDGNANSHMRGETQFASSQFQHTDGACDGISKVSTYEVQLGDTEHPLNHSLWAYSTRLSVANPQKGFRVR
jgi:hypothetical protein